MQTDVVQALTTGTQTYTLKTRYDSYYGRPVGQRFPNGETVQVVYGIYGDALAEQDPVAGTEYRRLNSVNARGQATQETFGNGVVLTPQYLATTGQLTELRYSKNGGDLRKLGYGYDVFGNLTRQTLNGGQSQEDYQYDQLHRLVQSLRSGAASGTVSYGFDAVGNFTKKTDFSANTANAYVYTGGSCGGGANAVKQITLANNTLRTFCYDANGNLTSDNAGLSLKYDHQNMLTVAQRGALRDDFRYGADGARTRSWGADGSRVYLPGYEHRLDTHETKVYVGDYAVITSGGGTPRKIDYLLKDRLGSVDAITNSSGTVTETRGYDAFGKPRSGTWADLNPAKMASTAVTPKGFTQHEHLNQLELIHMNGRVFDYNIGRFTGVDPFIQFPLNSQSLNPYSYILNNPLSGTDPSGYAVMSDLIGPGGIRGDRASADTQRLIDKCRHLGKCYAAGGGNDAKAKDENGADHISSSTTKSRDDMGGGTGNGGNNRADQLLSTTKRAFAPNIMALENAEAGGDFGDIAYNFAAAVGNYALDGLITVPGFQTLTLQGAIPDIPLRSKGMEGAAIVDLLASLAPSGSASKVGGFAAHLGSSSGDVILDVIKVTFKRVGSDIGGGGGGGLTLYHGTDIESALGFLNGAPLDAARAAASKIDGPPGFFLATHAEDAEFFALRRGQGAVLEYKISSTAASQLNLSQKHLGALGKFGKFLGDEVVVPTDSFDSFNKLRSAGEINVSPKGR